MSARARASTTRSIESPGAGPRTAAAPARARAWARCATCCCAAARLRRSAPRDAARRPGGDSRRGRTVLVRGTRGRVHVFPRRLLDVVVEEDGAIVRARWFRPPPGMSKGFVKGAASRSRGRCAPPTARRAAPRWTRSPTNVTDADGAARTTTAARSAVGGSASAPATRRCGVGARVVEKVVAAALARLRRPGARDARPGARARLRGAGGRAALRALHAPPDGSDDPDRAAGRSRGPLARAPAPRARGAGDRAARLPAAARAAARQARRGCGTASPAWRRGACGAALPFALTAAAGARHRRDRARSGGAAPMQRLLDRRRRQRQDGRGLRPGRGWSSPRRAARRC